MSARASRGPWLHQQMPSRYPSEPPSLSPPPLDPTPPIPPHPPLPRLPAARPPARSAGRRHVRLGVPLAHRSLRGRAGAGGRAQAEECAVRAGLQARACRGRGRGAGAGAPSARRAWLVPARVPRARCRGAVPRRAAASAPRPCPACPAPHADPWRRAATAWSAAATRAPSCIRWWPRVRAAAAATTAAGAPAAGPARQSTAAPGPAGTHPDPCPAPLSLLQACRLHLP